MGANYEHFGDGSYGVSELLSDVSGKVLHCDETIYSYNGIICDAEELIKLLNVKVIRGICENCLEEGECYEYKGECYCKECFVNGELSVYEISYETACENEYISTMKM